MGPQRKDWTFPKPGTVLIAALEKKREYLVTLIDIKLSEEQETERRIAEYREVLRRLGVSNWETAFPEDINRNTYGSNARRAGQAHAKILIEVEMYLRALKDDLARDPNRLYKLLADDLVWFEL